MVNKSKKKKSTKKLELSPKRIAKLEKQNAKVRERLGKKKWLRMSKDEYSWHIDRLHASAKLRKEGIPIDEDTLQKCMQKCREDREALAKASSLKRNKKKSKAYKKKEQQLLNKY